MNKSLLQKLLKKEMTRGEFLGLGVFAVGSLFGVAGIIRELTTKAAGPFVSTEPEAGTVTAPAVKVTDTTASAGQAIKFVNTNTTTGGGSRDNLIVGTYEPSYATTGLLPGFTYNTTTGATNLPNIHNGDWIITATVAATLPNRTIEGYIINGLVDIQTSNVTIRNCWIRGTANPTKNTDGTWQNSSLVKCNNNLCVNALITDCVLIPQRPTYAWNQVQGHHYTASRNYGKWTVDAYRVYNTNAGQESAATSVKILACFAEDFSYFYNDPNHLNDHRTHNDWVQIGGGSGTQIVGNKMVGRMAGYTDPAGVVHPLWPGVDLSVSDTTNPAINVWAPPNTYSRFGWTPTTSLVQSIQDVGQITDLLVDRNWVYSGATQLNASNGGNFPPPKVTGGTNLGTWSNNKFDRTAGQEGNNIAYGTFYRLATPGNTYMDNGAPANVKTQLS